MYSPSGGSFYFVPFPPISDTNVDVSLTTETVIPTMTAPLNIEDPVTKIPSRNLPLVPAKIEYTPTKENCHSVFSKSFNCWKRVQNGETNM